MTLVERILDLARWAPSGDNTQPWRFEIVGDREVVVHGHDTRDHCVYDLDGRPSQMAVGALLETMAIAASAHGLRAEAAAEADAPEEKPRFRVRFVADPAVRPSLLVPSIKARAVQRRALKTTPLGADRKAAIAAAAGPDFQVLWFERPAERRRIARILFRNAKLRLTMREAYEVHSRVIDWNRRFSEDRIPDEAVGVDPLTRRLMHWAMASWPRVEFMNTWLGGTLLPRIQLDLIPGIACAAHLALCPVRAPASMGDYVAAGRAMQRIWLEVTRLGLWLQPEMTPVIFSRYEREGRAYTTNESARAIGRKVRADLVALLGEDRERRLVFLSRLGAGEAPRSRSTRLPLERLLHRSGPRG